MYDFPAFKCFSWISTLLLSIWQVTKSNNDLRLFRSSNVKLLFSMKWIIIFDIWKQQTPSCMMSADRQLIMLKLRILLNTHSSLIPVVLKSFLANSVGVIVNGAKFCRIFLNHFSRFFNSRRANSAEAVFSETLCNPHNLVHYALLSPDSKHSEKKTFVFSLFISSKIPSSSRFWSSAMVGCKTISNPYFFWDVLCGEGWKVNKKWWQWLSARICSQSIVRYKIIVIKEKWNHNSVSKHLFSVLPWSALNIFRYFWTITGFMSVHIRFTRSKNSWKLEKFLEYECYVHSHNREYLEQTHPSWTGYMIFIAFCIS